MGNEPRLNYQCVISLNQKTNLLNFAKSLKKKNKAFETVQHLQRGTLSRLLRFKLNKI